MSKDLKIILLVSVGLFAVWWFNPPSGKVTAGNLELEK